MKISIRKVTEIKCPACDGKGVAKVQQPTQPGRKIYPPPCKECLGKGRIGSTALLKIRTAKRRSKSLRR